MPTNGLIVIAPVESGSEESLRSALNCIGNDINGKRLAEDHSEPYIDFPHSRTIHFARLALLDDHDRGPDNKRLLLVTDYDGSRHDHIAELIELTTQPDAIWGCCAGYEGTKRFEHFVDTYLVDPQAYYIAFPDLTVPEIRHLLSASAQASQPLRDSPPGSPNARLNEVVGDLRRLPFVGRDLPSLLLRHGPIRSLRAAKRVNATLDRVWWVRLFNRFTLNGVSPPHSRYSSAPLDTTIECSAAVPEDEIVSQVSGEGTPAEDLVSQNQLTLVTVVRDDQVENLRAVLEVINIYAQRLARPGSLVGVSTIHTVRWALLDGGKRLLLASNYDGTWENYIDEFAELILSGLDAIWESSYGFPQLGAQDVAALKHFLRCHQARANVFYSAYPEASILNIGDGSKLKQMPAPISSSAMRQSEATKTT
jgi:hypothetical protein